MHFICDYCECRFWWIFLQSIYYYKWQLFKDLVTRVYFFNYSKIWSHPFLFRQIKVDLFQSIDWSSIDWEKLTPEEKWRLEHMKLHEKHRGHESMHAEMILILFATLVISQIALVKWKQVYPNSYHVSPLEIWLLLVKLWRIRNWHLRYFSI